MPRPLPAVTMGTQTYIPQFASLLTSSFYHDPLIRSSILHQDRIYEKTDTVLSHARCVKFWIDIIQPKIEAGGVIIEAAGWAAAALWFPPNMKKPRIAPSDELSVVQREYVEKFDAVKDRYLQGRPHWYLNIIGRHPKRREPDAVRALIDPYIQKVKEERVPAFLEASSEHSRDVYAHLGFRVVEVVSVGVGHMDEMGNLVTGGKGMKLWGMIVEPEGEGVAI